MTVPRIMQTLIAVSALVAALSVTSASARATFTTTTSCPVPCKCFTNEHGIQAANCTDLPDQTTAAAAWPQRNLRLHFGGDHRSPVMLKNKAFRRFARLTYLDVTGATVQYVGNAAFDGLPELVELNLVGVGLRKLHRDTFAGNRKLTFLSLRRNPRLFVGPSFLASESVAELDLSECRLTSLKSVYFAGLPNLKYLFAARNELRALSAQFGPPGLKYVNLEHNRIEHVADDLDAYKRLRTVDLTGNPVNCTCQLSEVDRKLTGRGVAFGNTIACANMAGKPLGDLAEACGADGDTMAMTTMMGDDPDAMYKVENLLKLDEDQMMRFGRETADDLAGSGSGSGDDELIVDTAATRRTDRAETTTAAAAAAAGQSTTAAAVSSTAEPAATTAEQTEPAARKTTTTAAITDKVQIQVQTTSEAGANNNNNSSGIVPQTIQAPEEGEERGGGGDVQTVVAEYLKTNVGVTATAVVLAVIIFAIVYKAVCAGKKHRRMNGRRGPSADDQKPAVELKEIKYMAADTEDSHDAQTPRHDSPADSVNLLASGDEDDDSDDDDDDSGGGSPKSGKATADDGMLDSVMEVAERSGGDGKEDAPTRVIVKLGETPRASKPVAINNVH